MIPAEAVEAAAKAYRHALPYMSGEKALMEALEAAAPHMLAAAWGEGHQSGWNDRDDDAQAGWIPSGYTVDTPNPYRTPDAR